MGEKITASRLFAPDQYKTGNNRCYFCGLDCDDSHKTKDHVGPSFTNRAEVYHPESLFVCGCCVASTQGLAETTDISGETRIGRAGAPRMYSWVLSEAGNKAFNKKYMDFARASVLCPPEPPFSIVLADSGQKQLIFRSPVNHDRNVFIVQLEERRIEVDLSVFGSVLERATQLSAATGKKALIEPDRIGNFIQCVDFYGNESAIEKWIEIYSTPMGILASWLCKGKEDARNDECISGRIQEENCRSIDHSPETEKPRTPERTGNQLLFNFA